MFPAMIGIMGGVYGPVLLPAPEGAPHEDIVDGADPVLPILVLCASDEGGIEPDACPELKGASPWVLYPPWVFATP